MRDECVMQLPKEIEQEEMELMIQLEEQGQWQAFQEEENF